MDASTGLLRHRASMRKPTKIKLGTYTYVNLIPHLLKTFLRVDKAQNGFNTKYSYVLPDVFNELSFVGYVSPRRHLF